MTRQFGDGQSPRMSPAPKNPLEDLTFGPATFQRVQVDLPDFVTADLDKIVQETGCKSRRAVIEGALRVYHGILTQIKLSQEPCSLDPVSGQIVYSQHKYFGDAGLNNMAQRVVERAKEERCDARANSSGSPHNSCTAAE